MPWGAVYGTQMSGVGLGPTSSLPRAPAPGRDCASRLLRGLRMGC